MNVADLQRGPRMADSLPHSSLSMGEDDYRFRTRQLEKELSLQSKLAAELEQSNAQLQQQVYQADQTKIQLQERCSYLYGMLRAQLNEQKGNNEEIALLRGQLLELRGKHELLLAERLAPVASLPHGPVSNPSQPLEMVPSPESAAWVDVHERGLTPDNMPANASVEGSALPESRRLSLARCQSSDLSPEEKEVIRTRMLSDRGQRRRSSCSDGRVPLEMVPSPESAAWVDIYGRGLIPDNMPANAPVEDLAFHESKRLPLARCQSIDLSPEEKEVIRSRMLSDRGQRRRSSCSGGGVPSAHGEPSPESKTKPALERAIVGLSRPVKVEEGACAPEVDGSLPPRGGNDTSQCNPVSSPLPSEDCAMREEGPKDWYVGVLAEVKREPQGAESREDEPFPSREGPNSATSDSDVADQEKRGGQLEGHGCKEPGEVDPGEAACATSPPSVLPADSERSLPSSASYPMETASAHAAIPHNGVLTDSVESHGPVHDSRKPIAHQPTVKQGAAVASSSPTLESAAVSQDASAEDPRVFALSPAAVAEPKSLEVVASSAPDNTRISSEQSDALPTSPPSASNFRRNTGHLPLREARPDCETTTQIDRVEACLAKETAAVDCDGPSKSVRTRQAHAKGPRVENCVPFKDGRAPLVQDPVLDRYLYVTFCSVCRQPREELQAVALCQRCPRMFCDVCAAILGQNVDPAPGASDVVLSSEKCVCLQRDSEFPRPPKGVRPEAHLLELLFAHDLSVQFRQEVDVVGNPGYLGVITRSEMMDLGTMRENMRRQQYETTRGQRRFLLHIKQIWLNCRKFAGCSPESDAPVPGIVSCARILERMVEKFCDAYMEGQEEVLEKTAGNHVRHEHSAHLAQDSAYVESSEEPEFEESDEETESEPEPEMVDVLPPTAALAGRKRKAAPDSPPKHGEESSNTDRPKGCGASPTKNGEPRTRLCSLAGIGEKLLKGSD